ncbi:hypothetical protein OMP43_17510 [Sphingomonas sp. CBMAI 2297]|uniref:hypothetical protein n=1 Tax=Sphingomonas sp. CBMAI 2297 TaxID=2991720 RepID=UPI002455BA76|nr:hypothetical protein [Sphingomonas sp. CBMAI 2297]MDH4745826.1 hypothetical protein [Sphingomonas sp. CBMAI 2297]
MTTAADLFDLVVAVFAQREDQSWPTSAEGRVDSPGVLPTQPDDYPRTKLRLIGETKLGQGRGSIGFVTTPIIRVISEVSAPVSITDAKSSEVEERLWAIKAENERAIINSQPLFQHVQQLISVQTQFAFEAQATMLAGIQSDYTFEIYETAEDFAPLPTEILTEIVATDPIHPGVQWAAFQSE